MAVIFPDSKTFADSVPISDPALIIEKYFHEKYQPDFDLKQFVKSHFEIPLETKAEFEPQGNVPTAEEYIRQLWPFLTRRPENQVRGGSLLPLPEPYVVPGGRFREIYYWDSYFTMLGLKECGRVDLIENMIRNFAYLIDQFGHVPTGNRTYYLSRSQPPFFSMMVRLFSEMEGTKVLVKYLPQMQQEYNYWMEGFDRLTEDAPAHRRVVRLAEGTYLNRYWDDKPLPRPESYHEDVELAQEAQEKYGTPPEVLYRHIRAAAESGWDFSSRWYAEGKDFASTHTTDILPVDLNCLLYHLEYTLAETYQLSEQYDLFHHYEKKASDRSEAIQKYFWDPARNYFMDYDFVVRKPTHHFTLAGTFPLFFRLAKPRQARFVNAYLRLNFMRSGGLMTTLTHTGQQWDLPNGWAPLQWIAYKGLRNYHFARSAYRLRTNWLSLIEKEFKHTGKIMEKYNVANTYLEATGGEYEVQEGFGWTNGVYLRMKRHT
ncbi:alpha,alpha-trehalase [Rhabdobacter roseus]